MVTDTFYSFQVDLLLFGSRDANFIWLKVQFGVNAANLLLLKLHLKKQCERLFTVL